LDCWSINKQITTKSNWYKNTLEYKEPAIELLRLNEKEKQIYKADYIFITWSKQKENDKIKNKILKQIK
jgi:hypothetical protein